MAQATVQGVVERVNSNGIGFRLKESWTSRENREGRRFWSVFMPDRVPVQVIAGDEVRVTGMLRTAVSKTDARFVDHTIGNAQVEVIRENGPRTWEAPEDVPPADEYPPDDWAGASIPADY